LQSTTSSKQAANKLNIKQTLAKKVWLFGNTHAAWCTNKLGFKLLVSGSRVFTLSNQLLLEL